MKPVLFIDKIYFQKENVMENNLEFIIKSAVLVHYCGPGGDVAIPKGVTEIGGNAFDGCTNLTNVTIPESVNEIE